MTCPHHGTDACCPDCPDHRIKDRRGFPQPAEAKGRTRLQRCTHCDRYVDSATWLHGPKGQQFFFGCVECGVHAPR